MDTQNLNKVEELVEKFFYLDDESLAYFKKALYSIDRFPDIYKKLVGEDFRYRVKLTFKEMEKLDDGWSCFKENFKEFRDKYKITYKNFFEGKFVVDKNTKKLFKALLDETKEVNKSAVQRIVDHIGKMSLPKYEKLELVVSLNFADWFLSSTGEKWSSCYNLNCRDSYGYWSGLPGLIGDPNRSFIYLTDGTKKTEYGITVDKVISRTWGIVSDKEKICLVRGYPNSSVIAMAVNKLGATEDFGDGFLSIDKATPLYYKNGIQCIPYLDEVRVREDFYLDATDYGYMARDKKGNYYEDSPIFCNGGFKILFETGTDLCDCFEGTFICDHCADSFIEENVIQVDNLFFCEECFDELYIYCDCGKPVIKDEAFRKGNKLFCESCYKKLAKKK